MASLAPFVRSLATKNLARRAAGASKATSRSQCGLFRQYSSLPIPPSSKTADLIRFDGIKLSPDDKELEQVTKQLWMIPEFISVKEEQDLLDEIEPLFKKRRYIDTHWDGVITGYKEIEKSLWKSNNLPTIQKVKALFPQDTQWLPGVHVLDLAANGPIDAHIDSITASGGILGGLSLASSCVMTLKRRGHRSIQLLLEPRTLYVMTGDIRYEYTHEIPADVSIWGGKEIPRGRRISIMFRDKLLTQTQDDDVRLFKLTEDGAVRLG